MLTSLQETTAAVQSNLYIILVLNDAGTFETPKTFVALSTILTWSKTKIEDEENALTEEEYRRRKSHPNFKAHLALEKEIIKLGKKTNLKTYVIASGLVYHAGDSIFHHLFKSAWHNDPALTCYGDGHNIIPCVHLDDLVNITVEVIETTPETKYIMAVDESKSTLLEITKVYCFQLGYFNCFGLGAS